MNFRQIMLQLILYIRYPKIHRINLSYTSVQQLEAINMHSTTRPILLALTQLSPIYLNGQS